MKAIAVLAGLLMLPGAALAADKTQISDPNAVVIEGASVQTDGPIADFGAGRALLSLTAWDAQPLDSPTTYAFNNFPGGQGINRTAGSAFMKVPVQLPSGALVNEIELNYCDTGAGSIAVHWVRQVKNAPAVFVTNVVVSAGTPGCVVTTGTFTPAQTVDNNGNSYNLELFMSNADATIVFLSARVGYRLQVSPAPAVATFPNDVPTTHPFFRFVEALAASGVSGGCGPGAFCPDTPVTRGQMAVFLATALGMHFPN
jgi:hypothetical protein